MMKILKLCKYMACRSWLQEWWKTTSIFIIKYKEGMNITKKETCTTEICEKDINKVTTLTF